MTDKIVLFKYRLDEALSTLADAEKMVINGCTPRSITNRTYYAVFYATLALFIHENIKITTSKHTGVIATFDKEFIKTGKIEKKYSEIIHQLFDRRQESDYIELISITMENANINLENAALFIDTIKRYCYP